MWSFIKRYFVGLVVLLIALIVLFSGLALLSNRAPAPVSTVASKASHLASAR